MRTAIFKIIISAGLMASASACGTSKQAELSFQDKRDYAGLYASVENGRFQDESFAWVDWTVLKPR